jgi:L-rhamnose isomerase / sugar isomerase
MNSNESGKVFHALESFRIELPSWGFANTGTRFGKFIQPAAATTIEEKFSDAAQVHRLTAVCPSLALHVEWDFPHGRDSVGDVRECGHRYNIQPGSINPNLFQDQSYKHGSFGNPDPMVRRNADQADAIRNQASEHCRRHGEGEG